MIMLVHGIRGDGLPSVIALPLLVIVFGFLVYMLFDRPGRR